MKIELHIDRLVLDGVAAPHQAAAIRDALQTELTRLLAGTTPAAWHDSHRVRRLSTPDVHTGHSPAALGTGVARSVHGGITGRNEVGR